MMSDFLGECHGPMKLPEELRRIQTEVPGETCVIIKPGKNADGYWTNANLVEQVKTRAIPIFKALHPNWQGLFMFDNSQNHHAMPPDALNAKTLNLSDGGKNMKNQPAGWWLN